MKKIVGLILVTCIVAGIMCGCSRLSTLDVAVDAVEDLQKNLVAPSTLELNKVLIANDKDVTLEDDSSSDETLATANDNTTSEIENVDEQNDITDKETENEENSDIQASYTIRIDYSAQNGFGGYARGIAYYINTYYDDDTSKITFIASDSEDDFVFSVLESGWTEHFEPVSEEIDTEKIMEALDKN